MSLPSPSMNESEAQSLLLDFLQELGVREGDVLYLAVDMSRVPLPAIKPQLTRKGMEELQMKWCAFLLNTLKKSVGAFGTLLAPAFTYAYAGGNVPYVHETSPSETGPFTEYFRRHSECRSLHPLHSVAGIGAKARVILEDTGRSAFGLRSPFGRLNKHQVKFLTLGTTIGASLTYAHHLEQLYGVNYRYHVMFNTPVFRDGLQIPGPWLCFSRYLGAGVVPCVANLKEGLRKAGALREISNWPHPMQLVEVEKVDDVAMRMLDANPMAFISEPVEVRMDSSDHGPADAGIRVARYEMKVTAQVAAPKAGGHLRAFGP